MNQIREMKEESEAKSIKVKSRGRTQRDTSNIQVQNADSVRDTSKKKLKIKKKRTARKSKNRANGNVEDLTSSNHPKEPFSLKTPQASNALFVSKEKILQNMIEKPTDIDPSKKLFHISKNNYNRFSSFNNPVVEMSQRPPQPPKESRLQKRNPTGERRTAKNPLIERNKQTDLFTKWEKQYGGIKDRKLVIKDDHDYNRWYTGNQNLPDNDEDIQEDLPEDDDAEEIQNYQKNALRKNNKQVVEESNAKSNFELDWDDDDSMSFLQNLGNQQNQNHQNNQRSSEKAKLKARKRANNNHQKNLRVPKRQVREYKQTSNIEVVEQVNHFKSAAPKILDDWD